MEVFHVKRLPCQSNREKGNDVGGGFERWRRGGAEVLLKWASRMRDESREFELPWRGCFT